MSDSDGAERDAGEVGMEDWSRAGAGSGQDGRQGERRLPGINNFRIQGLVGSQAGVLGGENGHIPRYEQMQIRRELIKIESVEKLNSKNFRTWRKEVRMALEERELLGILVDGEEGYDARNITDAYKIIYVTCGTEMRNLIAQTDSPVQAWKLIIEKFEPKTMMTRIATVQDLFNVRQESGECLSAYLARVRRLHECFLHAGNSDIGNVLLAQLVVIGLRRE
jgi:hypothetical protein